MPVASFTIRLPAQKTEAPAVQSEEWLSNLYRRAELFPSLGSSLSERRRRHERQGS